MFYAVLCATVVHSAMHTRMTRPNSCLLVRLSFSVVILYVTVYLCICIRFSLLGSFYVDSLFVYMCFCYIRFSFFSTMSKRLARKNVSEMSGLGHKTLTRSIGSVKSIVHPVYPIG